jgi:phosphatidylglycerol---prolipoprotein diacylglyceryl transferase
MRPNLVTFGPVRIPSYIAMLYLALLAGTYTAYVAGRAEGLAGMPLAAAILSLLVPALLGARLAFVLGHWQVFRLQPRRIVPRSVEGGAVAYGALLSVPVSVPLLLVLGLPFAAFWDASAFGFLAAIICLRIGCLLNGCCCGRTTTSRLGWVVRDAAGVPAKRLPVQVWEAASAAALLVGATVIAGSMPFAGSLFMSTLGAYAAARLFLDFGRDAPRNLARLTVAQSFSVSFLMLSLTVLAVGWRLEW